ncbi:hypothetical protein ABG088_06815 [Hydrogenibacillus schlegelii]|uniref:hypothetical protein n=1 Tax=Hydrogenibacillus schlegelii TaxID=1484 RepID=UPI00147249A5|nr:hypothetical protein [Hydrogenibacillus schlegelii]
MGRKTVGRNEEKKRPAPLLSAIALRCESGYTFKHIYASGPAKKFALTGEQI